MVKCKKVCVVDVDQQMRTAIKEGDINKFKKLLDTTSKKFPELFKLVCNEGEFKTQAEFVRSLLERDRLQPDANTTLTGGYQLIHFASQRGLRNVLEVLLKQGADVETLTASGETVLHCLVRGTIEKKTNENEAVKCMEYILKDNKIDIDVQDIISDLTAIHLAAKNELWKIVQILIKHGAHIDINVYGVKARDLINKLQPDLIENYLVLSEPTIILKTQLFTLLLKKDEDKFLKQNNESIRNIVNVNNGRYTLLQAAITSGLEKAACKLIELQADVNLTSNGEHRTPAILAAIYGHDKILEALLQSETTDLSLVEGHKFSALHACLVLTSKPSMKCVKLLLEHAKSHKLDINAQDYRNYTALHYAAKKNYRDIVQLLLEQNVNIFLLNDQSDPAFIDIDPTYIKNYFDKSISFKSSSENYKEHYLIFDYNFLFEKPSNQQKNTDSYNAGEDCCCIPMSQLDHKSQDGHKTQDGHKSQDDHKSQDGHKLQDDHKSQEPEMEPLVMLSGSPNHRHLLNHPLIRSFLHLKWHRVYWFFYINFFIYFLFTASLSAHIYYLISSNNNSTENNNRTDKTATTKNLESIEEESLWKVFIWWTTLILLICIVVREIFQMTMSFIQYVCHIENCMEMALIVLTNLLLFLPTDFHALHSMSAIAILLAYTELVLLIGRHPSLATYISMFFRVSWNFFNFLMWFSLLIVAFGFSFYIIFQHCDSPDNCKKNFFSQLGTSLFKTVIMLTGEFELGDIEFDSVSVTSHIIFLLFIFFIAIVLLNLLNGLAVSDTQAIRDKAEIVCCAAQIKLYSKMENTLLRINKNSNNICCFGNSISCFRSIRLWLGGKILLLTGRLSENKLRVFLNDGNRMERDVRSTCRRACSDCATGGMFCVRHTCMSKSYSFCQLFNTIVSDARAVEAQRNRLTDTQVILARLDQLENTNTKVTLARLDQLENTNTKVILARLDQLENSDTQQFLARFNQVENSLRIIAQAVNAKI